MNDYESAPRPNRRGPAVWITCFAVLLNLGAVLLAWVVYFLTRHALGLVHESGTINASTLALIKAIVDPIIGAILALFAIYSIGADHEMTHASVNFVIRIIAGLALIVLGSLTILSYHQEGYAGIVGGDSSTSASSLQSRRVSYVPYVYNSTPDTPTPDAYITGESKRLNIVRAWVGSGVLEILTGLLYLIAVTVMIVSRRRRNRQY